jgi:hypothetical protein
MASSFHTGYIFSLRVSRSRRKTKKEEKGVIFFKAEEGGDYKEEGRNFGTAVAEELSTLWKFRTTLSSILMLLLK